MKTDGRKVQEEKFAGQFQSLFRKWFHIRSFLNSLTCSVQMHFLVFAFPLRKIVTSTKVI